MHACTPSHTHACTHRCTLAHTHTHTFAVWRNAVLLILSVVAQLFSLVLSLPLLYSIFPFYLISSACLLKGQLSPSPSFLFSIYHLILSHIAYKSVFSLRHLNFSLYPTEVNVPLSYSITFIFFLCTLRMCLSAGQVFSLDWQRLGFIGNTLWCTLGTLVWTGTLQHNIPAESYPWGADYIVCTYM